MKKIMAALLVILTIVFLAGCGKSYTCSICGKSTRKAYYDSFDTDSYFCEDCARDYYAPFPYEGFRID